MDQLRIGWPAACLLVLALADPAAGAPGSSHFAEKPAATAKVGAGLQRALARPLGPEGIAVAVALNDDDLPRRDPARRAAIQARQQRVLDALPGGSFRLKRRYASVSGFAGWAQRAAIEAMLDHPETDFVYLDGTVHATLVEGVDLIGANTAHSQGVTGSGVRVAILDTGIDSDHPDLSDDLAAQQCFCDTHPSPRFGCCPSGGQEEANAEDDAGHGTSVSGIVTSSRVSASGVAPDAEIVAVKVLDASGDGTFSDIAAGLDWVLTNHTSLGILVVNMSLGDGGEYNDASAPPCAGTNTANAIQALNSAGVAVFVASGNEGHDDGISFPACVAEAVSVGGVYDAALGGVSWCGNAACTTILCTDNPTAEDVFVCHSNSDELLDVLAPDWQTDTAALGGGTTAFGGTSASSPYAAAEAALLLQVDDSLTPQQIRTLLKTNGPAVVNPDSGLSFTRSDVGAAILAISPATCGNDVVENGEDCDDGNTANGDCCSSACQFEPATTVCRPAAGPCDAAETCTGTGGSCPADAFEPATTECRPAAGVCDAPDFCDGDSAACTVDLKLTSECRAQADICDIAEFCDGVNGSCPTDAFEPASTECRAAAGVCDVAETCTGSEANCPTDQVLNGVPCPDGDLCNGDEMCQTGVCVAGTPLVCDDGQFCNGAETCDSGIGCVPGTPPPLDDGVDCTVDSCDEVGDVVVNAPDNASCDDGDFCTADSCDEVTGCANTPIEPCGDTRLPATSNSGRLLLGLLVLAAGAATSTSEARRTVREGGTSAPQGTPK